MEWWIFIVRIVHIIYIVSGRGIRPAKVCEASKLQSLFGASRLKFSKLQSLSGASGLKAAKPLWHLTLQSLKASKPERLDALALWRLAALSGFEASKPERLDAVALWRLAALARFGASWRFSDASKPQSLKASKPERLDALALWRVSYASKPQSLKAWTLGCFRAFALWRFGALALWRLALLMLWCLLGGRFAALWRFRASWRFETSRLCDALALCGSLRHAILGKKWFCRFYFFSSTDWNIGIKAVSEKNQRARLFVFEGQRSPAASELTTTCLVIFVGCLMMVYLSRWLTSVVCKSPFRGS